MNQKIKIELTSSLIISLVISIIVFYIIQGFFADQVDEFIFRDLDSSVISSISILDYIIFAYTLIVFVATFLSTEFILKLPSKTETLGYTILLTILIMLVISYFSIKFNYPEIIVGPQYFLVSQGLFMMYVLHSQDLYYFMYLAIFISIYLSLTIASTK